MLRSETKLSQVLHTENLRTNIYKVKKIEAAIRCGGKKDGSKVRVIIGERKYILRIIGKDIDRRKSISHKDDKCDKKIDIAKKSMRNDVFRDIRYIEKKYRTLYINV